jgi:menaquinone-9 beta-reductase
MATPARIQIAGGGLAGLTLGIALRQRGVPATIFEAGSYPRHRVCGEFISGRGLEVLDELGLKEKFMDAGAIEAKSAAFFLNKTGTANLALPVPALCLSRHVMDKLLADEFERLGGDLRAGERWEDGFGEGVVRASGRRAQAVGNGWRWFGLKAHAKNVRLAADLELHMGENGYVGLCKLAGGVVNVCGLFRRKAGSGPLPNGFELLRGEPGTLLNGRLAGAEFEEGTFCSVAGLSLQPQQALENCECCIGDALTMIPPFTGNGMSLAYESACLAAGPLADYNRSELEWQETREAVARLCDENFSTRLAWAKRVQEGMFSPRLRHVLVACLSRSGSFWKMMFRKTR